MLAVEHYVADRVAVVIVVEVVGKELILLFLLQPGQHAEHILFHVARQPVGGRAFQRAVGRDTVVIGEAVNR